MSDLRRLKNRLLSLQEKHFTPTERIKDDGSSGQGSDELSKLACVVISSCPYECECVYTHWV